jgi:hypothetical protein
MSCHYATIASNCTTTSNSRLEARGKNRSSVGCEPVCRSSNQFHLTCFVPPQHWLYCTTSRLKARYSNPVQSIPICYWLATMSTYVELGSARSVNNELYHVARIDGKAGGCNNICPNLKLSFINEMFQAQRPRILCRFSSSCSMTWEIETVFAIRPPAY